MKIFDKFMMSDKTGELIIRYKDESMTGGFGTIVLPLARVKHGEIRYSDIEEQLKEFNEFSKVKIRDMFELIKLPAKELSLKGGDEGMSYKDEGLIRQLARDERERCHYRRLIMQSRKRNGDNEGRTSQNAANNEVREERGA